MVQGSDPGVPEALPRTLRLVAERLGSETVDRVWIFPPRRRGRREWGLVAVSRYDIGASDGGAEGGERSRRRLYTAAYTAERTGRELVVEPVLTEEGRAPPDRLPRVMEGVVRRSGDDRADAREVVISGDPHAFEQLVTELSALSNEEPGSILDP